MEEANKNKAIPSYEGIQFKFYKETNFQETPIGKIPKDWGLVRLGDKEIANIIMGQSPPSNTYNDKGNGLPFIQGKLEFGEIYPSPVMYCSKPIKIAEPGDVLVSVRAPVGDVNISPYRLCIGRGLAAIRFNSKKASSWFYFYYLQRVKNFLENLGKGSTFKAINKDDLENLIVSLPPLREQQGIVEVLSAVDLAIQRVDEAIVRAERLKKGLMQQLLTKGIGHKEFKETPIGKIPKDWELSELGEIIEVFDDKRVPLSEMERSKRKGPYPYCGATGIIDWIDGYIFDGEYVLLVEDGGPFGKFEEKAYIMSGKFWVNNHAHVLKAVKDKGSNHFLLYLLNYLDLNSYIVGSTRKKLNQEHMKQITIPRPPVEEQRRIAEVLTSIDDVLRSKRNKKEKLVKMKRRLMGLLLTGKVRVSL
ncbi:MAG: restriction endonuclease subunit S [Nitrososphaerota archaeon]